MQSTITVEGKVVGQRRPLFSDWTLPFLPEWESGVDRLTLRGLITQIVLEEVRAFQERQEQKSMIQALTQADIERGLMKGKVDSGGREAQKVEPQQAVATALQAFEDGLYYVFIDEAQQLGLDSEVTLRPESRVTFLRLVALAGG
jgi:hypothetical protein